MEWPSDGLAAFFLVCFFVGLLFTVASFFLGLGHGADGVHAGGGGHHGHLHIDHLHLHGGGHHVHLDGSPAGVAHAGAPAGAVSGGFHGSGHGPAEGGAAPRAPAPAHADGGPSPLNLSTIMAFLTWFGGVGFMLRTYYGAWFLVALAVAGVAGFAGAAIVFAFLSRVLFASQSILNPEDYRLPGTLARVTAAIRPGGTGEIVYTKGETRQVSGARSLDGGAIARDTEVVIMRYEGGLAYVQSWEELFREGETPRNGLPPP